MCIFVKSCFLSVNLLFQMLVTLTARPGHAQETLISSNSSRTKYIYHSMSECKLNEFYDLDTFSCVACGKEKESLQSTQDKFSCECAANYITVALYDTHHHNPLCAEKCLDTKNGCHVPTPSSSKAHCEFKLVNFTETNNEFVPRSVGSLRSIRVTPAGFQEYGICKICDLKYNYRYQDYCIANAVLKPYLKYNSFWQSTSANAVHFGDLKFVVFFCLALRNNTACNQLANLCVMSHYSADKNSPCSAFLLTQVSDVAIKYASMDDHLQATKPALFYKKGKQTVKMLTEPLGISPKQLQFFSTAYHLDGSLRRWGAFKMSQVNLCQMHAQSDAADWKPQQEIQFARFTQPIRCELTVENLIDLAKMYANNNFFSVFLNISGEKSHGIRNNKLQALPILIEDISPENLRAQAAEWQLVRRFQLIEAQPRHARIYNQQPKYEDVFKLSLYHSIRYVESFEMHYKIHDRNQIGIPLMKLRYRHIDMDANATLNAVHPFKLQISFERMGEPTQRKFIFEVMLPVYLFIALSLAMLQMLNYRKRHSALTATTTAATTECCAPSTCLLEFLLHFSSYAANASLLCFIIYIFVYPVQFLTQRSVAITLPIMKDDRRSLEILIYVAVLLKLLFICVHFWRISHVDLFLIDWERPRSCEANHFTLKNNLETSSVCSSVRTFTTENVSTWRIILVANEWIRLCAKKKYSAAWQGLLVIPMTQVFLTARLINQDLALQLFVIVTVSILVYSIQLLTRSFMWNRIFGDPLQKFIDLCSLANISVFMLLEQSFGFYIHGRSPNGFADTDMYSMLAQMQRNSQHRCSRKGLLGDSDQQSYIILPPLNLRIYFEKLLAPYQRSYSISQAHFQKEINTIDAAIERSSATFNSLNRFLCAFIDHAIKDMDYIIKEKTFFEKIFNCECDNYLTENKGTFYIDTEKSFAQLLLYGNSLNLFIMELALLLAVYILTTNLTAAVAVVYIINKVFLKKIFAVTERNQVKKKRKSILRPNKKYTHHVAAIVEPQKLVQKVSVTASPQDTVLLQHTYIKWTRQNVTTKTSIDQRFLM